MESPAARLTERTVPIRVTVVNTVLPVETRGTGGKHGWVTGLAKKSGVKRQTLSAWMGDRAEPDLESLRAVAEAIDVRLFELVAAMDGEGPVVRFDDALRAMIREEVQAYGQAGRGPRGASRE